MPLPRLGGVVNARSFGDQANADGGMVDVPGLRMVADGDHRSATRGGLATRGSASLRICSSILPQSGVSDDQSKLSRHIPPRSFAARRMHATKPLDFLMYNSRSAPLRRVPFSRTRFAATRCCSARNCNVTSPFSYRANRHGGVPGTRPRKQQTKPPKRHRRSGQQAFRRVL